MRLSLREMLLQNMDGKLVETMGYQDREIAHATLIRIASTDLGWDTAAWRAYMQQNFLPSDDPRPTFLLRLWKSGQGVAEESVDPSEAVRQLQALTGEDFDDDIQRLRTWMVQHLAYDWYNGKRRPLVRRLLEQLPIQTGGEIQNELQALTGEDFGRDVTQWRAWIETHLPHEWQGQSARYYDENKL